MDLFKYYLRSSLRKKKNLKTEKINHDRKEESDRQTILRLKSFFNYIPRIFPILFIDVSQAGSLSDILGN